MTALLGRILIAAIFAYFGYLKLIGFHGSVGYFGKLGFPLPEVSAVLAILFELGGGALLILGLKTRWVAWRSCSTPWWRRWSRTATGAIRPSRRSTRCRTSSRTSR